MGKLTVNMTEMDEAGYELVKGQILDCASGVDTLCIPIPAHGAPKHWTLLVKKGDQWHYYDTLEGGHPECLKYAHEIVKLFEGENAANIKLECRNHVRQKGADCGYFVIAYMEIEACTHVEGPASRGWPMAIKEEWQIRMQKIKKVLGTESSKLHQHMQDIEKKAYNLKKKQDDAYAAANEKFNKLKDMKCHSALVAMQAMNENSKFFRASDLSHEASMEIRMAETRLAPCSKCRFQTGCLRCIAMKAFAYWMKKEAFLANKVPKIEGPGLKGIVVVVVVVVVWWWWWWSFATAALGGWGEGEREGDEH